MSENREDLIEKVVAAREDVMHNHRDEHETDAEAVEAERSGRTNAARNASKGQGPEPGRWDSIGEGGEGLDELQGLYAKDASPPDYLPERGNRSSASTLGSPSQPASTITPALWDQLSTLEGRTIETPRGEPFGVRVVSRGEHVTVSPLDGGQEWEVPAEELEAAWAAVRGGARLDGLASIRLQEAGLGSAHPEYVAGLLHAIAGGPT